MTRIITIGAIDFTPADVIIELKNSANARKFIERDEIQARRRKNDKVDLTDDEYRAFSQMVPDSAKDTEPGGSAFNTCSTMAQAQSGIRVKLVTVLGAKKNAILIRERAEERHVTIVPPITVDNAMGIKTPVHYICFYPNGDKVILKHPGTVVEFLKSHPEYVAELKSHLVEIIADSDLFYLPGGITSSKKFGCDIFELALSTLIKHEVPFIFTGPTHGKISKQEAALYRKALSACSIFSVNAEEVTNTVNAINRLYKRKHDLDVHEAIAEIQKIFGKRYKDKNAKFPIAAITNGGEDTHIIMPLSEGYSVDADVKPVRPLPDPRIIRNKLGAGDNTLAGLGIGCLRGFDPITSIQIGMHLAQATMQILPAQLHDPKAELEIALKALGNPKSKGWNILAQNQRLR